MQYCDGGDLHSRLVARARTGRLLEERQVVDWFVQIALAVQFLRECPGAQAGRCGPFVCAPDVPAGRLRCRLC